MRFSKLTHKRILHILLVFPLALVVLTGPLAGFGTGLAKPGAASVQHTSAKPAMEEPPLTAMPITVELPVEEAPGLFGPGARAIGAMIIVLSLIWITMVLLKRYMPHRFGPLGHKRRIQVLETVPIGDKRSLTLVRIDDEDLLLASTPGSVSLIKQVRLTNPEKTADGETTKGLTPTAPSARTAETAWGDPREVMRPPKAAYRSDPEGGPDANSTFSETLAEEIRLSDLSMEGSLAGFARLRQELEAR